MRIQTNWKTNKNPFPHYWQVDLGRIEPVCKFSFNPIDGGLGDVLVKNYECVYSLDGVDFKTLKSGTYIPKSLISNNTYQAEEVEFSTTNLRYFRIVIKDSYDTRGYSWTGFRNALLYATNSKLIYLKKSDNNIYGISSEDNQFKSLISFSEYELFSKEEKIKFIKSKCSSLLPTLENYKFLNDFRIIKLK